ncbi:hypothetical protein LWI28_012633 [Acer negundo]|uniref:Uncharacterized protein n=1 Tax=Acer negundo TaxID=4023 RepID=A0AAD5P0J9_ACENE|nr:hypothetical protein LWI28_012633 [Acer negundo]
MLLKFSLAVSTTPLILPALIPLSRQSDPYPVDSLVPSSLRGMGAEAGSGTQLPVRTTPPHPAPRMSLGSYLLESTPIASNPSPVQRMLATEVIPEENVLGGPEMLDAGADWIEIEGTRTEGDQSVVTADPSKEAEEK